MVEVPMDTWLESVLTRQPRQASRPGAGSGTRGSRTGGGGQSSREVRAKKEKTELCFWYSSTGRCPYGGECVYAHGMAQMRQRVEHRRYKSRPCRNYHLLGTCPYGNKCQFFHEPQERHYLHGAPPPPPPGSAQGRGVLRDLGQVQPAGTPPPPQHECAASNTSGGSVGSSGTTSSSGGGGMDQVHLHDATDRAHLGLEEEMQRVEDELRRFM